MSQPPGLGTPGPHQPDFRASADPVAAPEPITPTPPPWPAAGQPWATAAAPGGPPADAHQAPTTWTQASAASPWATPAPQPDWGAPPPPPPRGARPGRVIAGVSLAVLLIAGLGGGALLLSRPVATPTAAATPSAVPPTVARTTPTAAPATSAPVVGGQLGETVDIRTTDGSGTITVTGATWTNAGVMPPEAGESYLILDVRLAATKGTLVVGPLLMTLTDQSGESHLLTFGPELTRPLATTILAAGKTAEGQLAFALPPGPATLEVLDDSLEPVATIRIGS